MQIPKNVVQAGEVDSCHKIYIEDYVNTFLKQYRDDSTDFCLYGKSGQEDGVSYYFIYGAIREEPGWETMQARYFPKAEQIGEATCDREESWLFFEDGYAAALDGYFIFYEQNEDMQSYLIAMHQNQPGEKTVEVRPRAAGRRTGGQEGNGTYINIHTDSLREKRAEIAAASSKGTPEKKERSGSEVLLESLKEPRRIRRKPGGYDPKPEEGDREKVLHAAQLRRSSEQKKDNEPVAFTGRAAGLSVLLLLCVIGIASINRYQDMQEVGNFFAETARGLVEEGQEKETQREETDGEEGQNGFVIEERQLPTAENVPEEVTFPVFAPIEGQEEKSGEETVEGGQAPEETQEPSDENTAQEPSSEEPQGEADRENSAPDSEETSGEMENTGDSEDASSQQEEVAAGPVSYTVQKGDSLAIICRRRYGNTDRVDEIISLNDFSDPNHLIPGQKILLPN